MLPLLDDEGKGAESNRRLGEPQQTWGICPFQPQRDWFGSGTPGALSEKWLFLFPLIRQFMAYLEGQGMICLAHVFSFIP